MIDLNEFKSKFIKEEPTWLSVSCSKKFKKKWIKFAKVNKLKTSPMIVYLLTEVMAGSEKNGKKHKN